MWISFVVLILQFLFLVIAKYFNSFVTDYVITFIILMTTIAIIVDININKKYSKYKLQIMMALILRIALLYFDVYFKDVYTLPGSGNDSEGFYSSAVAVSMGENSAYGGLFTSLFGYLFTLIGTNRLYAQFINLIFSMVAIIVFVNILNALNISAKSSSKILWILCLFPNFAIMSVIFLRESLMIMIVAFSLFCFILFYKSNSIIFLLAAIILSILAGVVHSGCVALAIGYVMTLLIFDYKNSKFTLKFSNIFLLIVFGGSLIVLFVLYGSVLFDKFANINSISDISSGESEGGSSYAKYVGSSATPLNLVIFTLPRIVFFLLSPLPFQWRGIADVCTELFDAAFYFCSIMYGIRAIKYSNNKNYVILLLVILLPTLIIFGWGVSNAGTAFRHRCKLVLLFATMFACGLDARGKDKGNKGLYKIE